MQDSEELYNLLYQLDSILQQFNTVNVRNYEYNYNIKLNFPDVYCPILPHLLENLKEAIAGWQATLTSENNRCHSAKTNSFKLLYEQIYDEQFPSAPTYMAKEENNAAEASSSEIGLTGDLNNSINLDGQYKL